MLFSIRPAAGVGSSLKKYRRPATISSPLEVADRSPSEETRGQRVGPVEDELDGPARLVDSHDPVHRDAEAELVLDVVDVVGKDTVVEHGRRARDAGGGGEAGA